MYPRKRTSIEIFVRQFRANNGHARRQSCPLQLMFETMWPSRYRAQNVSAVPRNYARQAKEFVFSTSVADLKFLQFSPHTLRGTSNPKATLKNHTFASVPLNSEVRIERVAANLRELRNWDTRLQLEFRELMQYFVIRS